MSRSYKKVPICGYTTAVSDKKGKKQINKRFRLIEKKNIYDHLNNDSFEDFVSSDINSIPKYTYLPKDGKQYLTTTDIEIRRKSLKK